VKITKKKKKKKKKNNNNKKKVSSRSLARSSQNQITFSHPFQIATHATAFNG
jgi:hypothetical protein